MIFLKWYILVLVWSQRHKIWEMWWQFKIRSVFLNNNVWILNMERIRVGVNWKQNSLRNLRIISIRLGCSVTYGISSAHAEWFLSGCLYWYVKYTPECMLSFMNQIILKGVYFIHQWLLFNCLFLSILLQKSELIPDKNGHI